MSAKTLPANQFRITKQKELIIEQLKKNPIVQAACEKAHISRATHYRWCSEDKIYAETIELAIIEGVALCNDLGESQLLSLMQSGDINAVKFFLRANHPRYKNKVEINGTIKTQQEIPLEIQEDISKALKLVNPFHEEEK